MNTHRERNGGRALARTAAGAALALVAAACQPVAGARNRSTPAPSPIGETVITAAEIAQMGAQTAWDVVRARAPRLRFGLDANGRPTTVRIQEPRTVNADETPLLVVDGVRIGDIGYLDDIPATNIARIRIIDGEEATQLYGIDAASGAIVVETKHGS